MELPVRFCKEMKRILGDEYEAYLASMNDTRKYGLRVNTAKISVEEFQRIAPFPLRRIPYIKNGFYYDAEVQPAKHPYYFAGLYYDAGLPAPCGEGGCGAGSVRRPGRQGN